MPKEQNSTCWNSIYWEKRFIPLLHNSTAISVFLFPWVSRRNHSTQVYTTLSPQWDRTAECVSWAPHLQVKRPAEQSVSGGPNKKRKNLDSYLIGMLLLLCGQRDPYTMFLKYVGFWGLHIDYILSEINHSIFPIKDPSLTHYFACSTVLFFV